LLNSRISKVETDRRNNPEYLHTEAYLEYLEANTLFETDRAASKAKAEESLKAIERCIKMDKEIFPNKNDDPDYIELRTSIEEFLAQFPS
jgi:hypothetical protein